MSMPRYRERHGFTLMEILMALMVFVIGSVSVWGLFIYAIETHKDSYDDRQSSLLAESLMAELKDVDVVEKAKLLPVYGRSSRHFPNYSYDLSFSDLEGDCVLVTLRVFYTRRGKTRENFFYTVLRRAKLFPQK